MKAVEITAPGGPEVLRPCQRPVPKPGRQEVLLRVAAAGINRPDILQRRGDYAPPQGASDLPGLEVAGEIVALGPDVDRWKVGDRVMALVAGGGYAEFCVAPAPQCLPVPARLTIVQAGAIPETFFTVWTNVFDRGRLRPGETFLVHGGTSGIGTTAIQLAHRFGARVMATAGSPEKCAKCRELGADVAIDYRAQDFADVVKDETQGKGVDLILDMVGAEYFPRNLKSLAIEGRLVQIAVQRGAKSEINLAEIMVRRQTVTGSTLRPRSVSEKGAIAEALERSVWPWLEDGSVRPIIHATFLNEAASAHRLMKPAPTLERSFWWPERAPSDLKALASTGVKWYRVPSRWLRPLPARQFPQ
jgi:putative PIG3 family NAD(P)H quinone oxidoreductase